MIRTRFAPTPSGFLHAGNGMSFIATWALARAQGGKILLRIDDLDAERMRPEYVEDIFCTLDWLGLDYDEGASGVDDFFQQYSQHKRMDLYEDALKKLKNKEGVYACDCSRKKIKDLSINGLYPNTCREKYLDFDKKDVAWRIQVPTNTVVNFKELDVKNGLKLAFSPPNLDAIMGDFIIRQKNGFPAYQIASLCDDMFYDINFIVRGEDLLHSTTAQIFLAQQTGFDTFCQNTFYHHELIKNREGVKLSKSAGDIALKTWREAGLPPSQLYQNVAQWFGISEQIEKPQDLVLLLNKGL
jgi:glutamyl/glutaminyl-tRNA synthetase